MHSINCKRSFENLISSAGVIYLNDPAASSEVFSAVERLLKNSTEFVAKVEQGTADRDAVGSFLADVRILVRFCLLFPRALKHILVFIHLFT